MTKLVSKNPVQRFKEGRKIEQFYGGGGLLDKLVDWVKNGDHPKALYSKGELSKPKTSSQQKPATKKPVTKNTSSANWDNSLNNNQNIVKDATNMIVNNLRNQTNNNPATNEYGFPKQGVNEYGFPINNTKIVTADNHYIGTKGNTDLYRRSALRAGVTNRNQVAALQRKLGLVDDGVWGANTQAAWEKSNGLAFTPTENISLELPTVTANNLAGISGNTSVVQPTRVEPVIQPRNYFNYTLPNYDLIAQNRLKQSGIRTYLKQGGNLKFKFSNKG